LRCPVKAPPHDGEQDQAKQVERRGIAVYLGAQGRRCQIESTPHNCQHGTWHLTAALLHAGLAPDLSQSRMEQHLELSQHLIECDQTGTQALLGAGGAGGVKLYIIGSQPRTRLKLGKGGARQRLLVPEVPEQRHLVHACRGRHGARGRAFVAVRHDQVHKGPYQALLCIFLYSQSFPPGSPGYPYLVADTAMALRTAGLAYQRGKMRASTCFYTFGVAFLAKSLDTMQALGPSSRFAALPRDSAGVRSVLAHWGIRWRTRSGAVPPTGYVLLSMLSVQVGAALAKDLFHALGSNGTVFLRIAIAALVLLFTQRPRIRGYARADYAALVAFGLVVAGMNTAFYAAIARLPLGIAVTIEFVGPLGIAVIGSRRRLDLLWGALASVGILLLMPMGHASLDPLGIVFSLLAGCGGAAYILLNVRVGRIFPGQQGLALGMLVAALAVLPFGVEHGAILAGAPSLFVKGAGIAMLSTVIPFSLEHAALKRMPARIFGVLMSLEPAAAALVGALLLGEGLGLRGLLALACVTIASTGSARFGGQG
jgi:inner membrane transporter RhtA